MEADAITLLRWIEEIISVITRLDLDLCGGPYFAQYVTPKPAWILNQNNGNSLGDTPRYLAQGENLSGTNMIWQRKLVEKLGFKVGIGLARRRLVCGDETEVNYRARQSDPGFKAYYDLAIMVQHLTRPETSSLLQWS